MTNIECNEGLQYTQWLQMDDLIFRKTKQFY